MGINYLEKLQLPHLPSIFGAMLAGVGYILMGAGVPLKIPGVLDRFAQYEPATYPLAVSGAQDGDDRIMSFAPREFMGQVLPPLTRPKFLAIIASNTLAITMLKKADGKVDGFVIEGPTAGGHNAPPRGKLQLRRTRRGNLRRARRRRSGKNSGPRRSLLARRRIRLTRKSRGSARRRRHGSPGGTAFAFCEESALAENLKPALLAKSGAGTAGVFTDPVASPHALSIQGGAARRFPFRRGSLRGPAPHLRPRLSARSLSNAGGAIDYRCSAEPLSVYVSKGGSAENTVGGVRATR